LLFIIIIYVTRHVCWWDNISILSAVFLIHLFSLSSTFTFTFFPPSTYRLKQLLHILPSSTLSLPIFNSSLFFRIYFPLPYAEAAGSGSHFPRILATVERNLSFPPFWIKSRRKLFLLSFLFCTSEPFCVMSDYLLGGCINTHTHTHTHIYIYIYIYSKTHDNKMYMISFLHVLHPYYRGYWVLLTSMAIACP
jgi:hypothetical protein